MEEFVSEINSHLKQGLSIAEVEKLKGFGKDTLRKKMRKLNYKFDRKEKIYVLDGVKTEEIEKSEIKEKPKKSNEIIKNVVKTEEKDAIFNQKEVEILKVLISNFEEENAKIDNLNYKKSKVVIRSFRSYEKVLDKFANYCKKKNLNQKDAIAEALISFMKKKL